MTIANLASVEAPLSPDAERLGAFIDANLPEMPTTFDEGLGIASERYAVNHLLLDFLGRRDGQAPIERVLEAPVDGLMGLPGMNSVVFARELGASVVVGSPSTALLARSAGHWSALGLRERVEFARLGDEFPYPDATFDWVWNYCTFEHFQDPRKLVREMRRVSRKYVCIVTQNRFNWGYPVHQAYHRVHAQPWDHGDQRWMRMGPLTALFREAGLRLVKTGLVDVPPWLDTFDMHIRGKVKGFMSAEHASTWTWSSLQPQDDALLAQNPIIRQLGRFQKHLLFPFDVLFAHHFYLIAEVDEGSPPAQFYDFSEGFGSVYGRYVRKRMAEELVSRYQIRSVLEAPCNAESYFASAGTQSVPFARAGCNVTALHPDAVVVEKTKRAWDDLGMPGVPVLQHADLTNLPFADGTFDLVWNFDTIPLLDEPSRAIAEMARVSRDLVMVIVPNALNVGYPVHALHTRLSGARSPWGNKSWFRHAPVERAMAAAGVDVVETGLVDSPPWPGFDALSALGRAIRARTVQAPSAILRTESEVEDMLRPFTFIEYGRLPEWLKVAFTHQLYVIGRKRKRAD